VSGSRACRREHIAYCGASPSERSVCGAPRGSTGNDLSSLARIDFETMSDGEPTGGDRDRLNLGIRTSEFAGAFTGKDDADVPHASDGSDGPVRQFADRLLVRPSMEGHKHAPQMGNELSVTTDLEVATS